MLRFLSSGESHGQLLVATLDGFPAGLRLDIDLLNNELRRRQQGYGRGARQKIENDSAEIVGGIRHGVSTGAPLTFIIRNRDFDNWRHVMSALPVDENEQSVKAEIEKRKISCFRPGHADLAGTLKFRHSDIRDTVERSSARETAARVAAGAACMQLLSSLQIRLLSHVLAVGSVQSSIDSESFEFEDLLSRIEKSEMFCADESVSPAMQEAVKKAWQEGDSLGGIIEIVAEGLPVGLGSYTQWDRKLDGQLAQALMSIQAVKAVEIGDGFMAAAKCGSQIHDALYPAAEGEALPFSRRTNHAGGLEGGMSNGGRLRLRAYMKPIPTLRKGLPSLSFPGFDAQTAHYERSDVCAVPAASVVARAMTAIVLASAVMDKFGGDNLEEISRSMARHREWCGLLGKSSQENKELEHKASSSAELE